MKFRVTTPAEIDTERSPLAQESSDPADSAHNGKNAKISQVTSDTSSEKKEWVKTFRLKREPSEREGERTMIPLTFIQGPAASRPEIVGKEPELLRMQVVTANKGQVKRRENSGVMPSGIPVLGCSICMIGPECPEFQEGFVCAFDSRFRDVPTRDLDDLTTLMAQVLEENVLRLRRARLVEDVVMGGQVDSATTGLSEIVMSQAKDLADTVRTQRTATVTASGEGALSRIFGSLLAGRTDMTLDGNSPKVLTPQDIHVVQQPTSTDTAQETASAGSGNGTAMETGEDGMDGKDGKDGSLALASVGGVGPWMDGRSDGRLDGRLDPPTKNR